MPKYAANPTKAELTKQQHYRGLDHTLSPRVQQVGPRQSCSPASALHFAPINLLSFDVLNGALELIGLNVLNNLSAVTGSLVPAVIG